LYDVVREEKNTSLHLTTTLAVDSECRESYTVIGLQHILYNLLLTVNIHLYLS